MKFQQPTLRKALKHIYYEYWMLKRLGECLQQKTKNLPDNETPVEKKTTGELDSQIFTLTSTPPEVHISRGYKLPDYFNDEDSLVHHNTRIEAFALHARGLLDFLYHECHHTKDSDVLAKHYFQKDEDWLALSPKKDVNEIKKLRDRGGQEVAHITYFRTEIPLEEKIWPVTDIVADIQVAFVTFIKAIPNDLLPDDWNIDDLL